MNIYDYFYSEEVANEFKKVKHNFSYKEMFIIIYLSYKPIELKVKGMKNIIENCKDYDLIVQAQKVIESYDELLSALKCSDGDCYYKVKFENAPYDLCPVFRMYDDAINYINESKNGLFDNEEYDANDFKERYSITKTEYFDNGENSLELKFIYDINDEIVDIKIDGERYIEDYDLINTYISTPVIFDNNGMRIINIYNPDFEEVEETYLLSDHQQNYYELRDEERSKLDEYSKTKGLLYSGPVSEYLTLSEDGIIKKEHQYVHEFMNMYFINESETILLEKQMKLKIEREIIRKMEEGNDNE